MEVALNWILGNGLTQVYIIDASAIRPEIKLM